jgi:transcriptional regulator with XRE-family HTH domain
MSAEWFTGRLKELREASGLTQRQLAEAAGLKEAGIRDLEQGRRMPSWETVLALGKALGVDCTAFATRPAEKAAAPRPRGRPRRMTSQEGAGPGPGGGEARAGTPLRAATGRGKGKGRRKGG